MADFVAILIICLLVAGFGLMAAPDHWQTPLGLLIATAAIVPAGIVVVTALKYPAVLVPAAFLIGVLVTRRAS